MHSCENLGLNILPLFGKIPKAPPKRALGARVGGFFVVNVGFHLFIKKFANKLVWFIIMVRCACWYKVTFSKNT